MKRILPCLLTLVAAIAFFAVNDAHLDPVPVTAVDAASARSEIVAVDSTSVVKSRADLRWAEKSSEPAFEAFRSWSNRFVAAPGENRGALEREGVELAAARREKMLALISKDPQRAVESAVPVTVWRQMPVAVRAHLETRVDTKGNVLVEARRPMPGQTVEPVVLTAQLGGEQMRAYGEDRTITRHEIPLSGIALAAADTPGKKIVALNKWPGRVLEPVEVAEAKAALGNDPICSTSGQSSTVNAAEVALSIGGENQFFCGPAHAGATLDQIARASGSIERSYKSTGNRRLLIYRVDFPDYQGQRVSEDTLNTLIGDMRTFWTDMSYGLFSWAAVGPTGSQVTPVLRLPGNADTYTDLGTFLTACRTAAKAQGYNSDDYDFDMVVSAAKPSASFGGVGYVGWKGCWLANSSWDLRVGSHELGHNVGLNHANYWDSPSANPIDGAGTSVEYGDSFDIMGGGGNDRAHFNAREKDILTWVPASAIHQATSGTYRIYAMDQKATGTSNLPRAIRIDRRNSGDDWWIDYRQEYASSNPSAQNGVWLHWGQTGNGKTNLIDMVPGGTKNDSPLQIGKTYTDSSDATNAIYITPLRRGNTNPDWVEVQVVQDSVNNARPTISLSATNTVPNPNVNTTITANAVDPDGDPLIYFWDMGDGSTTSNNAASITYKYPTNGNRTVRCTVTDGRGGSATGSIIIKVGGQTSFTIQGAVRNASGNPMEGVTVSAGGARTDVTDVSGNYTITNLPAANYTLTATKTGLSISLAAGITNPVAVGPLPIGDKSNINFIVAPDAPILGAMKSAIADAGSNTGDITLPLTDDDTPLANITLTGVSSNTAIIPNANITFGARGTSRTARVTAPANRTGNVTITITARDPQNNQTTTTWPITVNNNPTITGGTYTTAQDTPLDINLRLLATDDLAANSALAFSVSRIFGGTAEILPDGFTARFTPTPGYQGSASFRATVRDQSLSSRLVLLYDFEPPDTVADGKVSDYGNYHIDGTLNLVGTSEYNYRSESPDPLKPFSTKSLSFSDNGLDSAARLLRTINVNDLDFSNNATGWSFSTWVNRRSNKSDDIIFHIGDGDGFGLENGFEPGTGEELQLYFPAASNQLVLAKYGATGLLTGFTASNVGVNEWHHVAVTCSITSPGMGALSLYLDGFLVGTNAPVAMAFNQSVPVAFGGHAGNTNPGRWLDGSLDDVSVYSNVLPHSDVAGLASFGTRHYLGQAAIATINVNINGTNDVPTIQPIANRRVPSSAPSDSLGVFVSDAETTARNLIVTATSDNPDLVPNQSLILTPAADWTSTDVGAVGAPGTTTETAGTIVVGGSGAQIDTAQDEFRFVHLPMSGDGEIVVRVVSMDYTHEKGRSGIMFRAGTTDNAPFAFVGVGPGASAVFQVRSTTGDTTETIGEATRLPMPRWLRLRRTGTTVTAFHASDSAGVRGDWQQLGSPRTVSSLPNTVNAGLAVNSHVRSTLATTLFDNIVGDVPNGAKRKLTIIPMVGVPGTANITVTVSDGSASANTTFAFSTNTPPMISEIADFGLEQGTDSAPVPFTISDEEGDPATVTLSGLSSNQSIIANSGITFGGAGANRTVTLRAKPSVKGLVNITLTANDGQLTSAPRIFRVFVAPAGTMIVKLIGDGFGGVSGYFGESIQPLGKQITITAKAVGGQAFTGWRGLINSYEPKITFNMPAVMYLEADFTLSPYPQQAGTWNGLILDDPRTHEHTGGITMNVAKTGQYSGKLTYGGKTLSYKGLLHTDGTAGDAVITRKELSELRLNFTWNRAKHSMEGTVTDGTVVSTFVAHHALFTASKRPTGAQRPLPAEWLGKITALFSADPIAGPIGSGSAAGTVAGSGSVKLAGRLADGTPFSFGSSLSITGDLPFHLTLYKGGGSATGWLVWRRSLPTTDFTGSVTTFRPANAKDVTFSTGWPNGATLSAEGSYFVQPRAARSPLPAVLPFPVMLGTNPNAKLMLDGAGFLASERSVSISPMGKIEITAPEEEKMKLSLNKSGLLSGSTKLNGKKVTLCGAILQKSNRGAGYALTLGAAGNIELELEKP